MRLSLPLRTIGPLSTRGGARRCRAIDIHSTRSRRRCSIRQARQPSQGVVSARCASRFILPSAILRARMCGHGGQRGPGRQRSGAGLALSWRSPPRSRRWWPALLPKRRAGSAPQKRAWAGESVTRPTRRRCSSAPRFPKGTAKPSEDARELSPVRVALGKSTAQTPLALPRQAQIDDATVVLGGLSLDEPCFFGARAQLRYAVARKLEPPRKRGEAQAFASIWRPLDHEQEQVALRCQTPAPGDSLAGADKCPQAGAELGDLNDLLERQLTRRAGRQAVSP